MNNLQKMLFDLLCEFNTICTKYNITYYLSGGTLLGALRHEGFIPWDDDVDVNMASYEYKKLESVIDFELNKDRALISKNRYSEYRSPIPRYVRMDASLIRKNHLSDGTPHGVYLDILILDPMPLDSKKATAWRKKHYVYCELLEPYYIIAARRRNWEDIDVDLYRLYQEKSKVEGLDNVLYELENELFGINEADAEYYCMRFGTIWMGMTSINWYGHGRAAYFEGKLFPIPVKAELEMYSFYGAKWKYIPDVRAEHKTLKLIGIEAGNFEREFFKHISKETFNEIIFNYNDIAIDKYKLKIEKHFEKSKPYIKYIIHKIKKQVDKHGYDNLLQNDEQCMQIFQEYMDLQFSVEFIFNSYYIHIEDYLMNLLISTLFKKEEFEKIKLLLENREKAEGRLPRELNEKLTVANDFINLSNLMNLKDYCNARVIVEKYFSEYNDNLTLIKAKLEMEINAACHKDDYKEILRYAQKVLHRNYDDSELLKYIADVLWESGDIDCANQIYSKVMEITKNGIILLELSKKQIPNCI